MAGPAYISVDIETSGPAPGRYALLSIGACPAADPANGFYVQLQPDRPGATAEALAVSGLSPDELAETGVAAAEGMTRFSEWVTRAAGNRVPVFVALNAPFDWLFVADYFDRYVGANPFGHKALDIKALFMGATGSSWRATRFVDIAAHYGMSVQLPHHALEDARLQASLFARILEDIGRPLDGESP